MNDVVRDMLCEVIRQFGSDIVHEPNKLAAILRDKGAKHKRDVTTLIAALQAGVPQMLVSSSVSWEVLEPRLVSKLLDYMPLDEQAGRECVNTWGKALGRQQRSSAVTPAPTTQFHERPSGEHRKPVSPQPQPQPRQKSNVWGLALALLVALSAVGFAGYLLVQKQAQEQPIVSRPDEPQPPPKREESVKPEQLDKMSPAERAMTLLAAGNHEAAEAQFTAALGVTPGVADWHHKRAICRLALRRFKEAIDDCDEALRKDDKLNEARRTRGQTYKGRGLAARDDKQNAAAIRDLEESLRDDPTDSIALVACGDLYLTEGQHEKAIEKYDLHLRRTPAAGAVLANKAKALLILGKTTESLRVARSAVENAPESGYARLVRGQAYEKAEQLDRAERDFEETLRLLAVAEHTDQTRDQIQLARSRRALLEGRTLTRYAPDSATWLCCVDFRRIFASEFMKKHFARQPQELIKTANFRKKIMLTDGNPMTAATRIDCAMMAGGDKPTPGDPAPTLLILQGAFDAVTFTRWTRQETVTTEEFAGGGKSAYHRFQDKKNGPTTFVALVEDRLLFVSDNEEYVKGALSEAVAEQSTAKVHSDLIEALSEVESGLSVWSVLGGSYQESASGEEGKPLARMVRSVEYRARVGTEFNLSMRARIRKKEDVDAAFEQMKKNAAAQKSTALPQNPFGDAWNAPVFTKDADSVLSETRMIEDKAIKALTEMIEQFKKGER